jgi:hypothetical protein
MRLNPTVILLLIILTLVALAHVVHIDYEKAIEEPTKDKIEHLVRSDSDYSTCEVGCLIACSDREGVLQKECYCPCVDQCWNY